MVDGAITVGRIAASVGGTLRGDGDVAVSSLTHDSTRVHPGAIFCCVRGERTDGHRFAGAAVEAGAVALLVEEPVDVDVPQIVVDDVRAAMPLAAVTVHAHPAEALRTVGVTGTNGKTTVVSLIGHLLETAGLDTDVIGTLTGERTTPEAGDLQARLADDVAAGVQVVAMEVSSHALVLHRVDGMVFDVAVFTNLGLDHLDFHGTPEAYFAAKATLFDPEHCALAVVNVDDVHGRLLADTVTVGVVRVSLEDAHDLRMSSGGWAFTWRGLPVTFPLPGRHNVSNALVAAEACCALGIEPERIASALASAPVVPGRFELVDAGQPFLVVVDYAHTPDALERAIDAARDLVEPGARLRIVMGCGGDRDRSKRPLMGSVAAVGADDVVLTDDNPRSEDPDDIRAQVLGGVPPDRVGVVREIADRGAAIRAALVAAGQGDVVLIAGKGHEQGQISGDVTVPFDDRVVAAAVLDDLRGAAS